MVMAKACYAIDHFVTLPVLMGGHACRNALLCARVRPPTSVKVRTAMVTVWCARGEADMRAVLVAEGHTAAGACRHPMHVVATQFVIAVEGRCHAEDDGRAGGGKAVPGAVPVRARARPDARRASAP